MQLNYWRRINVFSRPEPLQLYSQLNAGIADICFKETDGSIAKIYIRSVKIFFLKSIGGQV